MKLKGKFSLLLVLVMIGAILAGCKPTEPPPQSGEVKEDIKIGVVANLTGAAAMTGNYIKNGVDMAIEEINAAGGINGHKVTYIAEDDEAVPAKSVSAITKLIEKDKVFAVIGPSGSGQVLATMEVAERYEVPEFAPNASNPKITRSGNEWIFRIHADDILHAKTMVDYIVEELKEEKIAIIYTNNDYGRTGMEEIVKRLEDPHGIEPLVIEACQATDKDFSSQILKAKASGATTLLISTDYPEGALLVKQCHQLQFNPIMASLGGLPFAGFSEIAGQDAIGVMSTMPYLPKPRTDVEAEWIQKATDKYGITPNYTFANAYNCMMILAKAIEEVGLDQDQVRAVLREGLTYTGPTGTVGFDETGNAIRDLYIVKVVDPTATGVDMWDIVWPEK
jgi:branched-chain amino acid transport system substrate-binding protein